MRQYHFNLTSMSSKFAVALCLFGLALAAEDNSKRNSRQILHPLVPLVGEHHGHSLYSLVHQPHILPPSTINYLPPSGPSVILPQPLSVPLQHSIHHPGFYDTNIYSRGPQVFNGPTNQYSHYAPSPSGQYHNDQHHNYAYQYQQIHHYPQGSQMSGFSFGRQQGAIRQPSAPVNENTGESNQFDSSNGSQRQGFLQSSSNSATGQFRSAPSQDSNEEQRFDSGSTLNQNLRGSSTPAQQPSGFNQLQSSGLSSNRLSPRLYGPSPIIGQFPSTQQSGVRGGNSQDSSQSAPNSNQQQTLAIFQGSFDQQRTGSPSAPSNQQQQNGNGLTLNQLSRYVEGSYSYTGPEGTPISTQYYTDGSSFNLPADNNPSGREELSRNFQPSSGQF